YTLSDRSYQILRSLKEPVKATGFFLDIGRSSRGQAENLLRQYHDASDKFKYTIVNPLEQPDLFKQYEKDVPTGEGVVFEYKGKKQVATMTSEQEFSQALLKLTKEKQPKAYFLTGHGEMAFEAGMGMSDPGQSISEAVQRLTNSQWKTEKLNL